MLTLAAKTHRTVGRVSLGITNWIGTTSSILAHSIFFVGIFALYLFGVRLDDILLILTTGVSLEAIYLAIFIQMTVNRHAEGLEAVGGEIEEIQENVKELGSDVEEISEDMEEISKDIDKIQESGREGETEEAHTKITLEKIETGLQKLLADIEILKQQK